MENKNVFDETVTILIDDARKLQTKLSRLQENNNFSEALSCMRLLKDTLSLIKEYDWELKYSEYSTDGHKEISIWEQNHCGEIKNVKKYNIMENKKSDNIWINKFESCISKNESFICTYPDECRGSGKSYAIVMMCKKYNGIVISESTNSIYGITNNSSRLGFDIPIYKYRDAFMRQLTNKIIFIDERSGLTSEQIEKLKETHLVLGFK